MSNKGKQIHNTWCDYMVEKANNTYLSYKKEEKTITGIKRNNMTRNEIITALAQ